jgi:hypothetical protein
MRKACWSFAVLILGLAVFPMIAWALNVDDVIELLKSGVGEQVILEQMNAEGESIRLTTEDILDLKSAGASDDLIREMIRRGAQQPAGSVAKDEDSPDVSLHLYYDPFDYYGGYWPYATGYYDPHLWLGWNFRNAGWWNNRWGHVRSYGHHGNGRPWGTPHPGDRRGHAAGPRTGNDRGSWSRGSAVTPPHGAPRPPSPPQQSTGPSRNGSGTRSTPPPAPPARQPQPSPGRSAWNR